MFGRICFGATIAALMVMVWGFVFWVFLGVPDRVMGSLSGGDSLAPAVCNVTALARGFLQMFASALLAAVLLAIAGPRLKSYVSRVGFVFLLGLFAAVTIHLAEPVWFARPWDYHLVMSFDECCKALLAGIVLAVVVRPSVRREWPLLKD